MSYSNLKKRFDNLKSKESTTQLNFELKAYNLIEDALSYLSTLNWVQIVFNLRKVVKLIKEIIQLLK